MWQTLCVTSGIYMFDLKRQENAFIFHLTDLTSVWRKELVEEQIVQIFQDCNPSIHSKEEEIIAQVSKILNEITKAQVEILKKDEQAVIDIQSNVDELQNLNFKIKFQIKLILAEDDKFTTLITVPLIQTVHVLEKQQTMLCNLLIQKDRELEEYRMEKGSISRTDLETSPFEKSTLQEPNDTLILKVFGESKIFMKELDVKYGKAEIKVDKVVAEPWNQVKKKRKIYNSKTIAKKTNSSQIVNKNGKDT